ncbi:hypothetical protein [Phenylobacterium sp.]|uniref:hypothetical protein n=1 Tax=Phenylobacterium sp. TaxID=1871053 RepID=UPI0030017991
MAMDLACDALEDIISAAKDMQDVIVANGSLQERDQAKTRARGHFESYINLMEQAAEATKTPGSD